MPDPSSENHNHAIENLLVGSSGCVACAEMPRVFMALRQTFARHIDVIMTDAAQRFVGPDVVELYSHGRVHTELFARDHTMRVPHLELTSRADLFVVMPASANILAKAAHGLCDDLLSTAIVASPVPTVFVPSMNESMWTSRVVQRNVGWLRELGHIVVDPESGPEIAGGECEVGAMPAIPTLLSLLRTIVQARAL